MQFSSSNEEIDIMYFPHVDWTFSRYTSKFADDLSLEPYLKEKKISKSVGLLLMCYL